MKSSLVTFSKDVFIILTVACTLASCQSSVESKDALIETDKGVKFRYLKQGEGKPVKQGMTISYTFRSFKDSSSFENPAYEGGTVIRVDSAFVGFDKASIELFQNMNVGDKVFARIPKNLSTSFQPYFLEMEILEERPLIIPESDSLVLVDIYNKMGGENWKKTWDLSGLASGWEGVSFNPFGYVTRIELRDNNLTGEIPQSFNELQGLVFVDLEENDIKGQYHLGQQLKRYNMITGLVDKAQINDSIQYLYHDSLLVETLQGDSLLLRRGMALHSIEGGSEYTKTVEQHGLEGLLKPYTLLSDTVLVFEKLVGAIPVFTLETEEVLAMLQLQKSFEEYFFHSGDDFSWEKALKDYKSLNESKLIRLNFENGIVFEENMGWEVSENNLLYPSEHFSFSTAFFHCFYLFPPRFQNEFIKEGKIEVPDYERVLKFDNMMALSVDKNDQGEVIRVAYEAMECGNYYSLRKTETGWIFYSGGAC